MLAGEKPPEDGLYRCQKCGHTLKVRKGDEIPKCPECAHDIYDRVDD